MKKTYSTPVSSETKTRIRCSILAGSTVNNGGQATERIQMSSTSSSAAPQTQNVGSRMGFFGE